MKKNILGAMLALVMLVAFSPPATAAPVPHRVVTIQNANWSDALVATGTGVAGDTTTINPSSCSVGPFPTLQVGSHQDAILRNLFSWQCGIINGVFGLGTVYVDGSAEVATVATYQNGTVKDTIEIPELTGIPVRVVSDGGGISDTYGIIDRVQNDGERTTSVALFSDAPTHATISTFGGGATQEIVAVNGAILYPLQAQMTIGSIIIQNGDRGTGYGYPGKDVNGSSPLFVVALVSDKSGGSPIVKPPTLVHKFAIP